MKLMLSISAYIAAIVAANVMTDRLGLVGVGFGLLVTAGTFAAGFALIARDFVNRYAYELRRQQSDAVLVSLLAISVGGVISYGMASPQLATASTVAFLGAELVDLTVFQSTFKRLGFVVAIVLSNIVAAPIDTLLFLHLAGFPVTGSAVTGQLIGKLVWATAVPVLLYLIGEQVRRRAVLRESVD